MIFQLIKANADFPNLVYLTLFQRDIVEKNLEKATSGAGKDFLEKIVQVGFDVPQVEQTKLQRVLFAKLDKALADPKFGKNFSQRRWGNLFLSPDLLSTSKRSEMCTVSLASSMSRFPACRLAAASR